MEPDIFEALGGFFRRRSADFDENMQRLREAFAVPDSPDFPGKGVLQDVGTGIDPTGGAIVPEREGASLPLMLAAGVIGPGLPADEAGTVLRQVINAFTSGSIRKVPLTRGNVRQIEEAISGASTEDLKKFDDLMLDVVMNERRSLPRPRTAQTPSGSHAIKNTRETLESEMLMARTHAELGARAQLGDELAEEVFTFSFDPEDISDAQKFLDLNAALDLPTESFIDRDEVAGLINERLSFASTVKALLGIDP